MHRRNVEGKQMKGAILYGVDYKPYLRASSCFKHAKFQSVVSENGNVISQRYWLVLCLDQVKYHGGLVEKSLAGCVRCL